MLNDSNCKSHAERLQHTLLQTHTALSPPWAVGYVTGIFKTNNVIL